MRPGSLGFLAALLALGAAGSAQAAVAGHCTYQGRQADFVDGAAWALPVDADEDEDEAPPMKVVFSTFTLDSGALARAVDRNDAVRDQPSPSASSRFELTFRDGAVAQQYLWMSPGTNLTYASNEVGRYQPAGGGPGRIAGAYRFTPEDGQNIDCEITFDLALLGDPKDAPPPPGVALPRNGGAPGAAYLAMNRAVQAGDIEAMLRLMPEGRAAELQAARSSPEFPQIMALLKAISPTRVAITGGRQDGDRAWVEFTAVEDGRRRVGSAEMRLEGGSWILVEESTRDP